MSLKLQEMVSKCQSCNYAGDPWESFCKVNKTHKVEQMFAYLDTESMKYEFHTRPDVVQVTSA